MSGEPQTNPSPRGSLIGNLQTGFFNFATKIEEESKKVLQDVHDTWNVESQLLRARVSLENFLDTKVFSPEEQIPRAVLKGAKGIIFLTIYKGGFGVGAQAGSGVLIVRTPSGNWSGPSSLGLGGGSFGLQFGVSRVDHIIVLQTDAAVRAFQGNAQVNIGGDFCVAAGPVGRNASVGVGAGDGGVAPMLSYSSSSGFFAGFSFDARTFFPRARCNEEFYGEKVLTADLMEENVRIPENRDYDRILQLLDHYTKTDAERAAVQAEIKALAVGDDEDGLDGLVSPPPEKNPDLVQQQSDSFGSNVLDTEPDLDIGAIGGIADGGDRIS